MTYLFGDSTPSTLQENFIDFLRDGLDCWVRVLFVAEHLREAKEKAQELDRALKAETERLDALGKVVARAVEDAPLCEPNSPTMRCAEAIVRSAAELVRGEVDKARLAMQAELTRLEAQSVSEREVCAQALATLLCKHDLPEATSELRVGQLGARYSARVRLVSATGLEALLELEIAPTHALAHPLQVNRLIERLDVQMQEGRNHKLKSHRLDKEYLHELYAGDNETVLKLRASADGGGGGFDLSIPARKGTPGVVITRTGDGESAPQELGEADVPKILELRDKVLAACRDLLSHRKTLIDARLDGTPLKEHANPRLLVERMVAALAPVAQEISRRSLTPTELVLKRQLGDGRREELFVTKEELRQKIASLPPPLRDLFAPLAFSNGVAAAGPPASAKPAPAPRSAAPIAPAAIVEEQPEEPTTEKALPQVSLEDWPAIPPPPTGKAPPGRS